MKNFIFLQKKNIDEEIVADRESMVNMINNPNVGPIMLSLKYLKICTGNFTSKELGRGAYGTVRYGCDNTIGTHFAVKCVSLQVLDQQTLDDVTQSFQREISVRIVSKMQIICIVHFLSSHPDDTASFLV